MFFFVIKQFFFYVKLILISIFKAPRDKTAPLTLRRIIILLALNTGLIFVFLLNWLCMMLDEIIFPEYRKVEIKRPFFTLGVPRSGSTLFYRLIAQDKENFTSTKLWELIFAPSIIQKKLFGVLGKIDKMLNGMLTRPIKFVDKRMFASSKSFHQIGLYLYEEDAIVLIWIFATFFLFFAFPFIDQFEEYLYFDDAVPENKKQMIMRYYKKCMQRHLYYHGAHKTLFSKNPTFAPMVRTLQEHFPDAVFLNTVRSPHQQIPSIYSFLVYFSSLFGGDFLKVPNYKQIVLEVIKICYLNPINTLKQMDEDKFEIIKFDDLVKELDKTIRNIYKKFNIPMNTAFEKILHAKVESSKNYKSGHKYSLEQFGLTPEMILEQYKPIFNEFGFNQAF